MESGVIYLCSCRITQRLWDFASSVLQMNGFEAITCKQLQLSCLYLTCWIISHSARGGEKVVEVVVGTCRTSIWLKNIYCSVFGTILWICGVSLHDCNKLFQSDFFSFSFGKFVSETFWTWLTWKRLFNISPHLGMTWVSQREKKEDLTDFLRWLTFPTSEFPRLFTADKCILLAQLTGFVTEHWMNYSSNVQRILPSFYLRLNLMNCKLGNWICTNQVAWLFFIIWRSTKWNAPVTIHNKS